MIFTEIKRFTIEPACKKAGVMLRWLNSLGGWECFYFGGESVKNLEIEESKTFLTDAGRKDEVMRRLGVEKLLVRTGHLTIQQAAGVSTIINSKEVYMQEGAALRRVNVDQTSYQVWDTEKGAQEISFTINIKRRNSQIG